MKKFTLLMLAIFSLIILSACNVDITRELGETFEFDDMEITLSENIGFARMRNRWSDHDGEYYFYIPVTVTNIGNESKELHDWLYTLYSPAGTSIDSLAWDFMGESISTVGSIQPEATKEGYFYVLHAEDGDYLIEFDSFDETIEVHFELEFDFAAVPEIQTEFTLGETLEVDGVEITIDDDISWGLIRSRFSDYDGENYFFLPVTVNNTSEDSAGFPRGFSVFAPNGNTLDSISFDVEEEDISRAGEVLPGASLEGYLHVLFVGDGEYVVEFEDWEFDDAIRVIFDVEFDPDAVPVVQTEFTLDEEFEFDDLEITISSDATMGTIDSRWSDLDGEEYFVLPVTVTNISDSTNSFPWGVTIFGPNGIELDRILSAIDADDITRSGDIRAGATLEGDLHILFNGHGEYVIEFSDFDDTIQVIFELEE